MPGSDTLSPDLGAVPAGQRAEIEDFLRREARLLDARRMREWMGLLTEDFTYRVPVTVTTDNPERAPYSEDLALVDETRQSLEMWAARIEPDHWDHAWGENPPQRIRRFVSDVIVDQGEQPDEFNVTSNVLLSWARLSEPTVLVPAGRQDVVRVIDGRYRLARRRAQLDEVVSGVSHFRLLF